jgi:2-methylcitrate dehydratase PrpD
MASLLEQMAEFVAGLRWEDVPPAVQRRARLQALSAFGAALASPGEPGARKVLAQLAGGQRPGDSLLWATGDRVSLHAAVVGNATSTCAFDWDEILLLAHPSHSAVTVAWGLGAARDATLGEVLCAQVAASELAGRLGLACFFGPQNGQHQPLLHHVGGAAAAARLLGLSAEATADALALALAQPQTALWPAFLGEAESKVLTAAHPAELGLAAAEHAAAGVRGPRGILDHPRGVLHRFAFLPAPRALGGLGHTWLTHTLQIKEHAACWYFQAPLDAMARLRTRVDPGERDRVRRIHCGATLLATAVHGLGKRASDAGAEKRVGDAGALSPNVMNFRLDTSLGLMWLRGRLTPAELGEANRPEVTQQIQCLAALTEVTHRVDLSQATVAAVHEALDLPHLIDAGPLALVQALARAGREFQGAAATAVTPREAAALAGALLAALRRLRRSRRGYPGRRAGQGPGRGPIPTADDPLADPAVAAAVASLALPCGGSVTVELASGRVLTEQVDVPAGAALDAEPGEDLARMKLEAALRAAGRDPDAIAPRQASRQAGAPAHAQTPAHAQAQTQATAILRAVLEAPVHTPVRPVLETLHR